MGLAVGVFVDAFIVRMTLIPAVMHLLGERAWALPGRLERRLPVFDIEGDGLRRELELKDWPEPDSAPVIAAEDVSVRDGDDVYAANLMSVTPKSLWPAVKAMLHSVYDHPTLSR
ncbi:hypothetical protein GCM10010489_37070 [Microbacterium saperdae]|nr:hypothetical protein GCM10010489_37070 [Microbacterium saperdae]